MIKQTRAKYALVTGASSGIGEAIATYLLEQGYVVFGVSRTQSIFCDNYRHIELDLTQSSTVKAAIEPIAKEQPISILVNAAGVGRFDPLESIDTDTIAQINSLNLTAPMMLSSLLLRFMKRDGGAIFFISSIEATRSSKFSSIYSATKSGLRAFSLALFEEVRKDNVRVVCINPDMTDTPFFEKLHFGVMSPKHLITQDIVDAIDMILHLRQEATVTELTIRAQQFGIVKKRALK